MKGLLVDFGGVLTTDVFASFREFCEREGLDPDTVRRLFREDEEALALLRRFERGELDEEEFGRRFGPMLGLSDHDGLVDRLFAGMRPDEAMIEAVKIAKRSGLRTGLVSNSWGAGRYDRDSFEEMFHGVVISGEVGLSKPEPQIFELGAERAGVPVADCVFVDDLRENCEGAERVGMTAVLHRGADGTLTELERIFGMTLRG